MSDGGHEHGGHRGVRHEHRNDEGPQFQRPIRASSLRWSGSNGSTGSPSAAAFSTEGLVSNNPRSTTKRIYGGGGNSGP